MKCRPLKHLAGRSTRRGGTPPGDDATCGPTTASGRQSPTCSATARWTLESTADAPSTARREFAPVTGVIPDRRRPCCRHVGSVGATATLRRPACRNQAIVVHSPRPAGVDVRYPSIWTGVSYVPLSALARRAIALGRSQRLSELQHLRFAVPPLARPAGDRRLPRHRDRRIDTTSTRRIERACMPWTPARSTRCDRTGCQIIEHSLR